DRGTPEKANGRNSHYRFDPAGVLIRTADVCDRTGLFDANYRVWPQLFSGRMSSSYGVLLSARFVGGVGMSLIVASIFQLGSYWAKPENGKLDRKSTRLNSSHVSISYAVF